MSTIIPSFDIPSPKIISNSQVLKGGAILFLTTFTLVFAPNGSPSPCFNCSARLISILTLA